MVRLNFRPSLFKRCSGGSTVRRAVYAMLAAALVGPGHAAVDLTSLSLEELLDVPIVGASKYEQKQSQVAAAVSVITRDEIKAYGWRTLNEALASLPGIHTTYDRQYSYLGTRGFGLPGDLNTRVLVTINGNRVNDAVYDSAMTGRQFPLDMDLVERIEFIPGPGGAVYGQNALFGVVNVVTRSGAAVAGTELAAGYTGSQSAHEERVSWGKKLDNGADVLLSASGYRAKGRDRFFDYPGANADGSDASGVAVGMDGERDKEFFAHLAHGPWSADFSYGDRRKDDPTATYGSDPLAPGQYQRDRYLLTQLQYQSTLVDESLHLSGRLFLGQHRYTALYRYGGAPAESTGPGDWHGFDLRLLSTAWAQHKLMLGLEYQSNTRQDQTWDDLTTPDVVDLAILRSGYRAGLYAQDEWTLDDHWRATLGLRLDHNNAIGNTLSPRAGLIWQATPATTWKALYGRAHRAPNVFERDYDDGGVTQVANPSLERETIDTLELVLDHRAGPDLSLHGSVYRWSMQNLVTLGIHAENRHPQYQNGENVTAHGVELSAYKTWRAGTSLRGSVSLQDVGDANGGDLHNSPEVLGKLNFASPLASTGLRLGYELQYSGARQSLNGAKLDAYWLSHLYLVADKWARGLEVSLRISNLFDTQYQHTGSHNNWQNAFDQDGRSVQATLSYRF